MEQCPGNAGQQDVSYGVADAGCFQHTAVVDREGSSDDHE